MFGKILGGVAKAVGGSLIGDIFGGGKDARRDAEVASAQNYAAQKEFAQNGLQWKAADARAAGLHPLAVLGSAGASFSPSFVSGPPGQSADMSMFDDMDAMAGSGQDTTRAQRAVMTDEQREMQAAQIRNQQLQNALLEGQLAEQWGKVMGQPSNPPGPGPSAARPTPKSGQANTGEVVVRPSESEATRINDPGAAAGSSPTFREMKISPRTSVDFINPEIGETFEAYGEFLKPFLAAYVHGQRLFDRYPRKNKGGPPRGPRGGTAVIKKKPQYRGNARRGASGSW